MEALVNPILNDCGGCIRNNELKANTGMDSRAAARGSYSDAEAPGDRIKLDFRQFDRFAK